jgi:hypothetical protein
VIAPQLLIYEVVNGVAAAKRQKCFAPDKVVEASEQPYAAWHLIKGSRANQDSRGGESVFAQNIRNVL